MYVLPHCTALKRVLSGLLVRTDVLHALEDTSRLSHKSLDVASRLSSWVALPSIAVSFARRFLRRDRVSRSFGADLLSWQRGAEDVSRAPRRGVHRSAAETLDASEHRAIFRRPSAPKDSVARLTVLYACTPLTCCRREVYSRMVTCHGGDTRLCHLDDISSP